MMGRPELKGPAVGHLACSGSPPAQHSHVSTSRMLPELPLSGFVFLNRGVIVSTWLIKLVLLVTDVHPSPSALGWG